MTQRAKQIRRDSTDWLATPWVLTRFVRCGDLTACASVGAAVEPGRYSYNVLRLVYRNGELIGESAVSLHTSQETAIRAADKYLQRWLSAQPKSAP